VEPGTSSEPRSARTRTPLSRLPIRLRLAVSVGAVTFLMLAVFGVAVRTLTAHRLRSDLNSQVTPTRRTSRARSHIAYVANGQLVVPDPDLTFA
jgi:hypothetical protein